jgi:anti-anti-sigma factor
MTCTPVKDTLTVPLHGEYDLANRETLRGHLDGACAQVPATLIVDCVEVTFMDAGTVDLIATAAKRQQAEGRDLSVANATGIVRKVFTLCGLEELLTVVLP